MLTLDLVSRPRYDPWRDLAANWPEVVVRVARLPGDLLGVVTYPVIVLRAGTSTAQQRSTLAHEIVHLERGIEHCGADGRNSVWAAREEAAVEARAALRLIRVVDLVAAMRELGACPSVPTLAAALEVDSQLLRARLAGLDPDEYELVSGLVDDEFSAA